MNDHSPQWLRWARELQAIAQTGLAFSTSGYDTERYNRIARIAAEMSAQASTLDEQELLATFLAHPGYATPKVDVRGAVIREGKILLVREKQDGKWCMPGGWADVGERPSEMVVREVREESGFDVTPERIVGVFDANREGGAFQFFHAYKIVFLCRLLGGEARPSDETLAVDFFSFDALPSLSMNRTHPRHLLEIQQHLRDPQRAAAFE
jgi:ADP-ribose pyrophosphatase YjhB (NUDIX family)